MKFDLTAPDFPPLSQRRQAVNDQFAGQGLVQVTAPGGAFDRRQSLQRGRMESPLTRGRKTLDLAQTTHLCGLDSPQIRQRPAERE